LGLDDKIKQISVAAKNEQLQSPESVQKTKAVRYSGLARKAYCKTDAPEDTKIVCYLDTDETGEEVDVYPNVHGGHNLDKVVPRLKDGLMMWAVWDAVDSKWRTLDWFNVSRDCEEWTEIEEHTANDTLLVAETGTVHSNLGATGTITLTLPASAPAGTKFAFAVQANEELRIEPGTAAIRDFVGQGVGKYKWADAIGECIMLVADSNGDWAVISKYGTWTEEV